MTNFIRIVSRRDLPPGPTTGGRQSASPAEAGVRRFRRPGTVLGLCLLLSGAFPARAEEPAPTSQLVPPRLVEFIHADYPAEAQQAGLEAAVKLALDVDAAGAVTRVEVLEPVGHGFDEAATEAARRFRFEPAKAGEQPVGVTVRFTYRFSLEQVRRARLAREAGGAAGAAAAADRPEGTAGTGPEEDAGATTAAAAPPTVRGRVLLRGDRTPLPELGVKVRENGMLTQTDEEGRFAFVLPPGHWTFEVLHPSYEPYSTEEELLPGEALDVAFYVEKRSRSRYRSVVRSTREKKTVTRTTLEEVELVQVPGTFGEPFRVVQTLPGVARSPFGTSMLLVRGAEPQDSAFLLDGHMVPDLYHFLSGPALINADLVESIDFMPGNYPVSYGRKQAGLVTATTRQDRRAERVQGQLALDLLDAEGLVRVPVGSASEVTVAARRSHFDLLLPLFTEENVRPYYWDYQLLGTTRAGGWKGKLMLFGGHDQLDYEDEPDSASDPGTRTQVGLARQFHQLTGSLTRTVLGDGTLTVSPMAGIAWFETMLDENRVEDTSAYLVLRSELRKPLLGEDLVLELGAELQGIHEELVVKMPGFPVWSDFPSPPLALIDATRPRTDYGLEIWAAAPAVWASLSWRLGPLLLTPGLRLDAMTVPEVGYSDLVADPRLIARLQLNDQLWLKGGVGIYHQQVNGQVLSKEYGNPETIDAPYALQQSLGTELKLWDFIDFDVTAYYNSYRDLIVEGRIKEEGGTVQAEELYTNDGVGRSYGVELLLRHRPRGRFFGWIAYTLSRSERRQDDEDWSLFALDQTHILSAVGSLDLGAGYTAGLRFQLVTGTPRTPVIGSTYDADTNTWTPILGEKHSARMPTFHQLDLRLDKQFLFDNWKMMVYLDIQNVYNHDNPEFPMYSYDYSQTQYINGIPFLPSLGIKGEF